MKHLLLVGILGCWQLAGQEHGMAPASSEHPAAAAHDGGKEAPGPIWKWANFAMLAVGLGYMIGKHAPSYFSGRDAEIQKGIEEAKAMSRDAEAQVAEITKRIAGLDSEIAGMKESAKEEMQREASRIGEETAQILRKIEEQGQNEIQSATKAARQELKSYSAGLALQLASEKLRGQLTPEADAALVASFLKELK